MKDGYTRKRIGGETRPRSFFFGLTSHGQSAYLGIGMTERRIVFLQRVSRLVTRADKECGIRVLLYWYNRTEDQQKALYAIGRIIELHRNPVTNCDGVIKISKHQVWEAVDLVIVVNGVLQWNRIELYEELGRIVKEEGLRWGGDWDGDEYRDPNDFDAFHFEYKEAA